MRKYKKILFLGILLIALTGCTNYIDPVTKQVKPEMIITLGDAWDFGSQGWFSALFVWPIAQLLNFFAQYVGAFGAILVVTLLIKLLTLKGTIQSTIQQQKMQLIGPEQAKIEEKYRNRTDEQAKLQKATEIQKLFEKHEIKPMAALGGAFLQIPIMLAMYQAVGRSANIINGSILGQSLIETPMDGFKTGNVVIISIYILMAICQALSMFLPQYLAKKKMRLRPYDPKPKNNANGMMYTSLIMIVFIALQWNVGMSLYWMISALAQLLQTLFINWKFGDK